MTPVRPDAISSKPRHGDPPKLQRFMPPNPESKRSKRKRRDGYVGKSNGVPWSNRRGKGLGARSRRRR